MKKISLIILFSLCAIFSFAQTPYPNKSNVSNDSALYNIKGAVSSNDGSIITRYADTLDANKKHIAYYPGAHIIVGNTEYTRDSTGTKWIETSGGSGALLPAGAITTIPVVGTNPGTNLSSTDWIINTFYGSQSPTATLTGGGIFEFTSASTASKTLNWGAGRQSATQPLATIVVAGNNESFSQPSAPGTVTGTQSVTVTTNTSTTYNNVVTTTDSKTATASTTFTYENKIYAGFVTSSTPTDADIIAATGSTYVGGMFSLTRNQSGSLSTPSSSKYFIFASPASFGTPNITINGLGVTFDLITRDFTNSSGFTVSYIIAVSPYPTAGQVDTYLVN